MTTIIVLKHTKNNTRSHDNNNSAKTYKTTIVIKISDGITGIIRL